LLVDEKTASRAELERVADVVSHENAHMWFGDLVTMQWWNGIWLNEAFATFMEMLAVDAWKPHWERWVSFGLSRGAAMAVDGLNSTRSIEYPVHSPSEAGGMFDVLTYEKGASVLRMLEQYLGAEAFRKGISLYLKKHQFANTETGDLWDALQDKMAALNEVAAAADEVPADTDVAWTGRTMKVPWFAEHMREELVLHGWDITGDCDIPAAFRAALAEPWMTTHSVLAVGRPLLTKGVKKLAPGERIEARLRVPGTDDVFVSADAGQTTVAFADPEGPATLETDAAARVLLLWGRRPADPARICSRAGADTLGRVRRLLGGY